MTNDFSDPAVQWSDLLASLHGRRREAVVEALRSSAEKGWPADAEGVRLLVAYTQGEIDAQDYAVGVLVSLGAVPQPIQPAPTEPLLTSVASIAPRPGPASVLNREDAAAAYVAGKIPVEEFLRITRGVSA